MDGWTQKDALKAKVKGRCGAKFAKLIDGRTIEIAPDTVLSYYRWTFFLRYPDGSSVSGSDRKIHALACQLQPDKAVWVLSPIRRKRSR